jgi:hypothetical protein
MARGLSMKRFIEGEDRHRGVLFPEYLDDWVSEENPVRAIDVFVDALALRVLGFEGVEQAATGRPGYHPGLLLSAASSPGATSSTTPRTITTPAPQARS